MKMPMTANPAILASVIATMVLGLSLLLGVWLGDCGEGFVVGDKVLGMTAIAGEVVSEIFGGSERVEGIEQGVFNG
uniref:Uncharacterized protein n=1 Tax=Noccaea caerulescens TaxID=107243 RepID=A0A1J3EX69_NOCCA